MEVARWGAARVGEGLARPHTGSACCVAAVRAAAAGSPEAKAGVEAEAAEEGKPKAAGGKEGA